MKAAQIAESQSRSGKTLMIGSIISPKARKAAYIGTFPVIITGKQEERNTRAIIAIVSNS